MTAPFNSTPTLMTFWRGTPFPQTIKCNPEEWQQSATDMIKLGLQHDVSLAQQIEGYTEQLNGMESWMCKQPQGLGLESTKKILKKMQTEFGMSVGELQSLWYLNVFALLKLKVIENDNDNGMLMHYM